MNRKRVREIVENPEILDIYYHDDPVWIQQTQQDTAKVGFMNGTTQDVFIEDLYEKENDLSHKSH